MVLRGDRLYHGGAQVGSWGSLGSRSSLYFVFTREKERSGQVTESINKLGGTA